jgi:hypothetical protein
MVAACRGEERLARYFTAKEKSSTYSVVPRLDSTIITRAVVAPGGAVRSADQVT